MQANYPISNFTTGDRIRLAPHADFWMRGIRYGTVLKVGRTRLTVALESMGRVVTNASIAPTEVDYILGRDE